MLLKKIKLSLIFLFFFSGNALSQTINSEQFLMTPETLLQTDAYRQFMQKYRGTDSSGGGGILATPQGVFLLDLFQLPLSFEKLLQAEAGFPRVYVIMEISPSPWNIHTAQVHPSFQIALAKIQKWGELSAPLISTLSPGEPHPTAVTFFDPITWYFIDFEVPESPIALTPGYELRLAAYYITATPQQASSPQVYIYGGLWNRMGVLNQAGLLIHESLRYKQVFQKFPLSEEELQQVTALLLLCKPEPNLARYIQDILTQGKIKSTQEKRATFKEVVHRFCQMNL